MPERKNFGIKMAHFKLLLLLLLLLPFYDRLDFVRDYLDEPVPERQNLSGFY